MLTDQTSVALFASLVRPDQGTTNTLHVQLVVTSGGFQVVSQHGQTGGRMIDTAVTDEHIAYDAALERYNDLLARRERDGWEQTVGRIPSRVQRYADGHRVLTHDELQALLDGGHGPQRIADPTRGERVKKHNERQNARVAAFEKQLRTFLDNPNLEVRLATQVTFTIEKSGGAITCDTGDAAALAIGRRAALEIGGTFSARGYVDGDAFCIVTSTPERADLLKGTRPTIVCGRPARDVRAFLDDLARGTIPEIILIADDRSLTLSHTQFAPIADRVLTAT